MNSSGSKKLKNFINSNDAFTKWYQTVIWWEIYRIPYNIIMLLIGVTSIAIAAVNIPFVYMLIALALNFFYSLLWITELFDKKELLEKAEIKSYRKKAFLIYLLLSIFFVSLIPITILVGVYK